MKIIEGTQVLVPRLTGQSVGHGKIRGAHVLRNSSRIAGIMNSVVVTRSPRKLPEVRRLAAFECGPVFLTEHKPVGFGRRGYQARGQLPPESRFFSPIFNSQTCDPIKRFS